MTNSTDHIDIALMYEYERQFDLTFSLGYFKAADQPYFVFDSTSGKFDVQISAAKMRIPPQSRLGFSPPSSVISTGKLT